MKYVLALISILVCGCASSSVRYRLVPPKPDCTEPAVKMVKQTFWGQRTYSVCKCIGQVEKWRRIREEEK